MSCFLMKHYEIRMCRMKSLSYYSAIFNGMLHCIQHDKWVFNYTLQLQYRAKKRRWQSTSSDEPKNKCERRLTRDKEPETRDKKPFSADVISLAVRLEVWTIPAFRTLVFRVRRAHFDTAQWPQSWPFLLTFLRQGKKSKWGFKGQSPFIKHYRKKQKLLDSKHIVLLVIL